MEVELLEFIKANQYRSREEIWELLIAVKTELIEATTKLMAFKTTTGQMSHDYKKLEAAFNEEKSARLEAEKKLSRIMEQNCLKTDEIFGRSSEKMDGLSSSAPADDESFSLHDIPDKEEPTNVIPFAKSRKSRISGSCGKKGNGRKQKGKRDEAFSKLPQTSEWYIDPEKLDELYGKDGWEILFFERRRSLEEQPSFLYVKNKYFPILKTKDGIVRPDRPAQLYSGSFVSESLLSGIVYKKFFLGLPDYRIEKDYHMKGYDLSRQTMINWTNNLCSLYLGLVWNHMYTLYLEIPYHQCDETYVSVNKDGREPGSKSFMWVHVTSEHYNGNPIVLFCYEKTRSAEHLRKFYYKGYSGYISCDAYSAYMSIENDKDYGIIICGCFMHSRRRFVEAYLVAGLDKLTDDEVKDRPEFRVLILIQIIYLEENKLKDLFPEERHIRRQGNVLKAVCEFFRYLKSLDIDNPELGYSSKFKEAVRYSLNQEEHLRNFLKDGNIPLDDGKTERAIRSFAVSRHSWMFFDTVFGAETGAIIYSIVETAKAAEANVYFYLRYLFEKMPAHMNEKDRSFLADMMPWSATYKRYEVIAKEKMMQIPTFFNDPPPKYVPASSGPPRSDLSKEPPSFTLVS